MILLLAFCCTTVIAKPLRLYSNEFPIGVYSADHATEDNFRYLKSIGVNYVHTYGMGSNTAENNIKAKKFLDLANKFGLKVMFNLKGRIWANKKDGVKELKKLVRKFKKHPALGFWYLYDEPLPKHLPALKKIYRMLKFESPDIPVALVTPWIKGWGEFAQVCDILMVDLYPVRDKEFPNSKINHIIDFTRSAVNTNKMIIPVFQAINWKIFADQLKGKGYNESKFRFPNRTEMRFWIFSSLCLGVRGQFYYSYYNAKYRCKGQKWLDTVLAPCIKESRKFVKLVGKAWKPTKCKYFEDQKVYSAFWKNKKSEFLVIANNSPASRKLSVPLLKQSYNMKFEPWGETRKISISTSKGNLILKSNIKPWEVLIWKIK